MRTWSSCLPELDICLISHASRSSCNKGVSCAVISKILAEILLSILRWNGDANNSLQRWREPLPHLFVWEISSFVNKDLGHFPWWISCCIGTLSSRCQTDGLPKELPPNIALPPLIKRTGKQAFLLAIWLSKRKLRVLVPNEML
jgi:hypothetical protein